MGGGRREIQGVVYKHALSKDAGHSPQWDVNRAKHFITVIAFIIDKFYALHC